MNALIDITRLSECLRLFWNEGIAPIVVAVSSLGTRMDSAETKIENIESPFFVDEDGDISYRY